MIFVKSLRLDSLLSFPPGSPAVKLRDLNVIIGPNGSGKSNFIKAIELLHATPTNFASAINNGGGIREWLWKGSEWNDQVKATIDAHLKDEFKHSLYYQLSFKDLADMPVIETESLMEIETENTGISQDGYTFRRSRVFLSSAWIDEFAEEEYSHRLVEDLAYNESVLSHYTDLLIIPS